MWNRRRRPEWAHAHERLSPARRRASVHAGAARAQARGAGASAARRRRRLRAASRLVEVADDGRGAAAGAGRNGGGHRLDGLRERVALYDGTLQAGERPDGGFLVRARLPVHRP
jgi:hypothetical protein